MSREIVINSCKPKHSSMDCPYCHAKMEFETPSTEDSTSSFKIKCWNSLCEKQTPFDPKKSSGGINNGTASKSHYSQASTSTPKKPFKMGTDEEPVSKEYYEILGVSHLATTAEIKKLTIN